jgi:hypothetical protein
MIFCSRKEAGVDDQFTPIRSPGRRSQTYQEFIDDQKALRDDRQVVQFESYARGLRVDVSTASYAELKETLRKFLIWKMYS